MGKDIPKVGAIAPEFCLKDQDASDVCLKDFEGQWVVLYFYPKDDTPGCTKEACEFTDRIEDFRMLTATVLGVSPDSIGSHERFMEKHDLKIRLLSDASHEVLEEYGAWRPKKLYGKDLLGVVRSTFLIDPEGRIAYIWPKVKVRGHVLDVEDKLRELRGA